MMAEDSVHQDVISKLWQVYSEFPSPFELLAIRADHCPLQTPTRTFPSLSGEELSSSSVCWLSLDERLSRTGSMLCSRSVSGLSERFVASCFLPRTSAG